MVSADPRWLAVEVVYVAAQDQRLIELSMTSGTTIAQAIEASGVLREFPEIDLTSNRVGVFGRLVRLDDRVQEGDRVEIYRPLQADPKEARRRRARVARRAAGERG